LFATHYFEITRLPNEAPGAANVHLAAAESAAGIVFLHEVRSGPASRSYGIQVAQRAGIPPAVIRHASRELSRLEAQGAPTPQLDLFSGGQGNEADAAAIQGLDADTEASAADISTNDYSALKSDLASIDPDQLTPREALDILYRLRTDHL
jgi:DNA mismatch repair protein MutS